MQDENIPLVRSTRVPSFFTSEPARQKQVVAQSCGHHCTRRDGGAHRVEYRRRAGAPLAAQGQHPTGYGLRLPIGVARAPGLPGLRHQPASQQCVLPLQYGVGALALLRSDWHSRQRGSPPPSVTGGLAGRALPTPDPALPTLRDTLATRICRQRVDVLPAPVPVPHHRQTLRRGHVPCQLPAGRGRQLARQDGATVSAAKLYAEVFGGDAEALQALQTRDMPDVVKRLLEWDGAARVVLETPAEAARRERETTMPSAETLAGKKVLERASRSWNLPV